MTERWTDERLDRLEAVVEANSQAIADAASERQELREVFLSTMQVLSESSQRQQEREAQTNARLKKMDENIDALITLTGRVTEQTAQLKRTMDYLLSNDGG